MTAPVFFWNLRASRKLPYEARIKRLLKLVGLGAHVRSGDLAAIKLHFGESGGMAHVQPLQLKPLLHFLRKCGARPFLTDTNTLYVGQRGEAVSHGLQAAAHGFDPNVLGAPVLIADGLKSGNERTISCPGKHFDVAYVAGDIVDADIMVTVSHFKGHDLAGFGGALKNVGMGCATRRGKMQQHCGLGPTLHPAHCTGCGNCVAVCNHNALALDESRRITIDRSACVGCAACFLVCTSRGLEIDWRVDVITFLERMAEYTAAILLSRSRPTLHIAYIQHVSPGCDCTGYSDAPICPDLGVLASWDPVALDQACLDLVNQAQPLHPSALPADICAGQDKFEAIHGHVRGAYLLEYAESLGLGHRQYNLQMI
ncbi:MAG: DUF362 domain-containing protein [Desulfovibrionales bacterium]|nr:DUF362 domain-containing protein [Desulfovibrionales bacterium]